MDTESLRPHPEKTFIFFRKIDNLRLQFSLFSVSVLLRVWFFGFTHRIIVPGNQMFPVLVCESFVFASVQKSISKAVDHAKDVGAIENPTHWIWCFWESSSVHNVEKYLAWVWTSDTKCQIHVLLIRTGRIAKALTDKAESNMGKPSSRIFPSIPQCPGMENRQKEKSSLILKEFPSLALNLTPTREAARKQWQHAVGLTSRFPPKAFAEFPQAQFQGAGSTEVAPDSAGRTSWKGDPVSSPTDIYLAVVWTARSKFLFCVSRRRFYVFAPNFNP